jgi:hypothetical protein
VYYRSILCLLRHCFLLLYFPLHLLDSSCWPGAYTAFVIWLELSNVWVLAFSKRSNRICVFSLHPRTGTDTVSETSCSSPEPQ